MSCLLLQGRSHSSVSFENASGCEEKVTISPWFSFKEAETKTSLDFQLPHKGQIMGFMEKEFPELKHKCTLAFIKHHLETDKTELGPIYYEKFGNFVKLPFDAWAASDDSHFASMFALFQAQGFEPQPELLRHLGSIYMPEDMRARFIGPSEADKDMPTIPFECREMRFPEDYDLKESGNLEKRDLELEKLAMRGIMASVLHWYTAELLGRCEVDAVKALLHPASTDLPLRDQLAFGMFRELYIVPRFGSTWNFWKAYEEMRWEGGTVLNAGSFSEGSLDWVYATLSDNPTHLAMAQLLVDMGVPTENFSFALLETGVTMKHPTFIFERNWKPWFYN